jgi:hypothetical protein
MRFDLGAVIMVVTIAFSAWAILKIAAPAKRSRGLRIGLTATKPDEEKQNQAVDP